MDVRPEDQDETTERAVAPTEGVRIIGAEEAADALERGAVQPRLPEGAPRYGDRPAVPDRDRRPQVRFPLDDPTELDALRGAGTVSPPLPPWTDPPTGEVPRVFSDARDAGRAVSSNGAGVDAEGEDDLDAWMGVTAGTPRWRDHPNDWDEPDYVDFLAKDAGGEEQSASLSGGFPEGRWEDPDFPRRQREEEASPAPLPDFFAQPFDPEPDPTASSHRGVAPTVARGVSSVAGRSGAPRRPGAPGTRSGAGPRGERVVSGYANEDVHGPTADLGVRVVTGVAMGLGALILFSMGPAMALAVVVVVLVAAVAEFYGMLQKGGHQPATLVGLVATASIVLATYWRGSTALPVVLALTVMTTLLWHLMGVTGGSPTLNVGMTFLGVGYVGVLGSFAALILRFPNGVGILIGLILVVVANDVGALFVGRRFGTTPLASHVSPNKTRQGLMGGTLCSLGAALVVLGVVGLHPWSVSSAVLLGLLVGVLAPLGDLCESMIKRDIGVKDAGTMLPGHGGVLDRFDALLFVLPAVYYLCRILEVY